MKTSSLARAATPLAIATRAIAAGLILIAGNAHAGPPLITDDAQALGGAGLAELIVATTGLWREGARQVDGPVVDVTLGLNPTLDATLVASVSRLRGPAEFGGDDNAALLCPGIKWQALGTGRFNVSLSPALLLDINDSTATAALLPVQAEMIAGNWIVGIDAGHIATRRGDDQWQAGTYASWTPSPAITVLAELWAISARPDEADRGFSLGLDVGLPAGQRLLFGWGSGLNDDRPAAALRPPCSLLITMATWV